MLDQIALCGLVKMGIVRCLNRGFGAPRIVNVNKARNIGGPRGGVKLTNDGIILLYNTSRRRGPCVSGMPRL